MLPKNVRQIGQIEGNKRIYIEDYVMTYARKIEGMAVLLGRQEQEEEDTIFYIHGAVEVKNVAYGYPTALNNEDWSVIYADVKKHFLDYEIMGWLLVRKNVVLEIDEEIRRIHEENFKGNNKILFLYDKGENEEAFYLSNIMGDLKKQSGYYIFYEKNEAMQNYMIEKKPNEKVEEEKQDDAMVKVREIIAQKEPQKSEKKVMNLMYGASTLLAAAVLVIGATMLDNYDKMKNMEQTLNTISDSLEEGQTAEQDAEDVVVQVEKMEGNTEKEETEVNSDEIDLDAETTDPETIDPEDTDSETINPEESEGETAKTDDGEDKPDSESSEKETGEAEDGKEKEKEDGTEKSDGQQAKETNETVETSASATSEYIVEQGDTLASISMKFYQSYAYMDQIQELNKIDDSDMIYAGQKLILP